MNRPEPPWATAPIPCPPVLLWAGGREDQEPEKRGGVGGVLRFLRLFLILTLI